MGGYELWGEFPNKTQVMQVPCVCGHWANTHRRGGRATCEGPQCGCYTFRTLREGGEVIRTALCPVCGEPVLGRTSRQDWLSVVVTYLHEKGDCDTVVPDRYFDYGYDNGKLPPDPNPDTVLPDLNRSYFGDRAYPETQQRLVSYLPPDPNPPPFNPIKVDEYLLELALARAERDLPTRAPRVLDSDEHV